MAWRFRRINERSNPKRKRRKNLFLALAEVQQRSTPPPLLGMVWRPNHHGLAVHRGVDIGRGYAAAEEQTGTGQLEQGNVMVLGDFDSLCLPLTDACTLDCDSNPADRHWSRHYTVYFYLEYASD